MLDDVSKAVAIGPARLGHCADFLSVIDGHYSSKCEGGELFDERFCKAVNIVHQQFLKLLGVGERSSIYKSACRINGWILTFSGVGNLVCAPATDGVEVVECKSEGIDFRMA